MITYDAIIPAGGEIDDAFAGVVGTKNKALIEFEGVTVLERIVLSLRESGKIRRIAVTGPTEVHESRGGQMADLRLMPGNSGPDNILRGLDALSQADAPDKVVVVTSDLPFFSADIARRFIESCPTNVDICLPLVDRAAYETMFPGSTSTFVRLKDGSWTAGCMYLLDVKALRRAKPYIDQIFEVRKSKLGMAKLLGPGFLLRFITKSLTVADLERKIESMLQCSGRALPNSPAELAFDLDYLDDYEFAVKHMEKRA